MGKEKFKMRADTALTIAAMQPEKKEQFYQLAEFGRLNVQLESIKKEKDALRNHASSVIQGEGYDELTKRILEVGSEKAILAMDDDQLTKLYTNEDGEVIKFNVPDKYTDKAKEKVNDLRKDFAVFIFNSETEIAKLDSALEEMQVDIEKTDQEVKELFKSFGGNITDYVRKSVDDEIVELEAKTELSEQESIQLQRLKLTVEKLEEAVKLESVLD